MKPIRNILAGSMLAGSALVSAAAAFSFAQAADDPAAPTAAAPAGHGPHGMHAWGGPMHFLHKLGLTAEQQASVKSIMTAAKPQMQTLHESMRSNHLKLMQTKPDDPNYATVVAEVAQSNATFASQRTSQAAELWAQVYAVLTPTQKTQLATLEAQWAAEPRSGHWGPRGQGAPAGAPTGE